MVDTEIAAPPLRRLIVGISGASGTAYGVAALRILRELGIETHLVMTRSAMVTVAHELPLKIGEIQDMASVVHRVEDIGAAIASGSFRTMGMLVAPCSIRSLSEIAYGTTSNLLTRAADVVLKERRRLVLMVRETPLHLGHLRAMTQATADGATIRHEGGLSQRAAWPAIHLESEQRGPMREYMEKLKARGELLEVHR